jgi:hypothetical protein
VDHVAPKEVDGLVRRFEGGFERIRELDVLGGRFEVTDTPPDLTITLIRGRRSLRAEREVLGVAADIDRIAETERWTRCGPSPGVPCDEPAAAKPATLFAGGCPRTRPEPRPTPGP